MGRSCVAAVVQADVAPNLGVGLERTAQLAQAAARSGAVLIVFPETWLPGYPAWLDVLPRCRALGPPAGQGGLRAPGRE